MKIYLDFDGTVVEHKFPKIGTYNSGAKETIESLHKKGYEIILNTYRVDINIKVLKDSREYLNKLLNFKINNIEKSKIDPPKWDLTKAILEKKLYIDDISEGCPLKLTPFENGYWVDWYEVRSQLIEHNIL